MQMKFLSCGVLGFSAWSVACISSSRIGMPLILIMNMGKSPVYMYKKSVFLILWCLFIGSITFYPSSAKAVPSSLLASPQPDSLYLEAQSFMKAQQYDAALLVMERAVEMDPDKAEYWELLLLVHQELGDVNGAITAVEELIRLLPDVQQNYLDHAFLLTFAEKFEEALQVYDTYIDRFGLDGQAVTSRARIFQALERPEEAIEELEALLKADPTQLVAYAMLAEFYTQSAQYSQALTVLDEGQNHLGDQPLFNISRAVVLRNMGRIDASFEQLAKGFDSHMFDLDYKAGTLYNTLGLEPSYTDEQILELADQLVRQYPVSVKAHAVKGDIYAQFGRLEEAKASYETAVTLSPEVPQIWEQLISISNFLGLTEDAIKHGKKAA